MDYETATVVPRLGILPVDKQGSFPNKFADVSSGVALRFMILKPLGLADALLFFDVLTFGLRDCWPVCCLCFEIIGLVLSWREGCRVSSNQLLRLGLCDSKRRDTCRTGVSFVQVCPC